MSTRTVLFATCLAALLGGGYWLARSSSAGASAPSSSSSSSSSLSGGRTASVPAVATHVSASRAMAPALPSHAPELVTDLRDADPKVRRAAIHELAGSDVDAQLLLDASRDRDLEVGVVATIALGKAYKDGRVAVSELVTRAQDSSLDPKVRSAALSGLGVVPSPEAAALLAGLATTGSTDDRASAVILLRNQDLALAVPALIGALGDAEPRVRELAHASLTARSRGRDFGEDRAAWQAWWTARR